MKINIYYGGRGLLDDPTLYVICLLYTSIKLIEPPVITTPVSTCDKLVELWKWNEFGDVIRNMTRGISCAG